MISKFTKKYIIKQIKINHLKIQFNYEKTLIFYCKLIENYGYKLEFRKGRNLTINKLNANAGYFKNSSIVVTPEWAYQLIINNSNLNDIFLITLGHELTHKDNEICILKYGIKYIKMIAYTNEIHADFGAAQKMFNCNRKVLIKAIDYKLNYKKEYNQKDKSDFTHPSWARRLYYAENYNFNEDLIKKIAEDVGYKNEKLIKEISEFYDEIILK